MIDNIMVGSFLQGATPSWTHKPSTRDTHLGPFPITTIRTVSLQGTYTLFIASENRTAFLEASGKVTPLSLSIRDNLFTKDSSLGQKRTRSLSTGTETEWVVLYSEALQHYKVT